MNIESYPAHRQTDKNSIRKKIFVGIKAVQNKVNTTLAKRKHSPSPIDVNAQPSNKKAKNTPDQNSPFQNGLLQSAPKKFQHTYNQLKENFEAQRDKIRNAQPNPNMLNAREATDNAFRTVFNAIAQKGSVSSVIKDHRVLSSKIEQEADEIKKIAKPQGKTDHQFLAQIAKLAYKDSDTIKQSGQNLETLSSKKQTKSLITQKLYQNIKENGIDILDYSNPQTNNANPSLQAAGKKLQQAIDKANPTGLQMLLLENSNKNEAIIAFRGTDGVPDVIADLNLGLPQYNAIKEELDDYVKELQKSNKSVTFTGHSLGGGLAEIASYTSKKNNPDADISFVSFNGFGSENALKSMDNNNPIDENIATSIKGTLYKTRKDPVGLIGRHISSQTIIPSTGVKNPIAAHTMKNFIPFLANLK